MQQDLIRTAMSQLVQVHRQRAQQLGKGIPEGYPKWNNNGEVAQGPVQDFYYCVGNDMTGVEPIGTQQLLLYANGDQGQMTGLNALTSTLYGHPLTLKR